MQYMLLQYVPAVASGLDEADMQAWIAYTNALADAGVLVGGEELHPAENATTLRQRDGQRDLHDGPYAETKEQLGGFYVIDVPDLDAALDWAARSPAASAGAIEVRPVVQRG